MKLYENNRTSAWTEEALDDTPENKRTSMETISENQTKPRLLLVEDDWLTLQMMKRRLEKKKYEVITAKDEKEFWEHAFDPRLSLIILDLCLKRRLGTDVYKSLLDFGADRHVPVIFTTGMAEREVKSSITPVFRENNYAFMEKPIQFEKLTEEIERLLQYRRLRGAA